MNFVINIPFIKIRVYQAQKRHWRFFNDLLFQDSIDGKNIITIDIFFEKIKSKTKYILEKDAISDGQNFFYQDVKGNKVTINWSQLKVNYFKFIIDPNFDLYAFFTFILEPIFIILGAQNNILFLHASGVVKKNQALIFPAWRNTGKTNTILLECKRGSHFLGDDYVILKNKIAYLYPKALNLFSYNFEAFPEVYKYLPLLTILKLKLGIKFKNFLHSLSQSSNGYLSKTFYRLSELAEIATKKRLEAIKLAKAESAANKEEKAGDEHQQAERLDGKVIEFKGETVTKKKIATSLKILKTNVILPKPIRKP